MKNKKLKKMMSHLCVHVCDHTDECSWTTKIRIQASGGVIRYSRYLGDLDCPTTMSNLYREIKKLNIAR